MVHQFERMLINLEMICIEENLFLKIHKLCYIV